MLVVPDNLLMLVPYTEIRSLNSDVQRGKLTARKALKVLRSIAKRNNPTLVRGL